MPTTLSALITTLVLGSSSVALASHGDDAGRGAAPITYRSAAYRAPRARPLDLRERDDHRHDDLELRGDLDQRPRRYRDR